MPKFKDWDDVPVESLYDVDSMTALSGTKLVIPTPLEPAGGQSTHPSVLFFPDGWGRGKWKYWMAMTPYKDGNDAYEDPCILVSNNGISWQAPVGVTNPLADASGNPEYHSDVDLKMGPDDTMYLFYRWYSNVDNGGTEEHFRLFTTKDGFNWSGPSEVWINDHDVRKVMSPSFVYENGGWTMWGVDILPSPNQIIRTRSNGSSPTSGWATPTVIPYTSPVAGKEAWHIYVNKEGGRYYGLLNDCTLDAGGGDGDLWFMQSYDGTNWDFAQKPSVPKVHTEDPTLHDRLYRSCLFPATENGVKGFRVIYTGWRNPGVPVWNLFRTFLRSGSSSKYSGVDAAVPMAYDVPSSPTGWQNTGSFTLSMNGDKATIAYDLHFYKPTGAANLAISTAFTSLGIVVPPSMRVKDSSIVRYAVTWLSGSGFNVQANLFVNFYTGEALIRMQSGTATMVPGVLFDLEGEIVVDAAQISQIPSGPYPEPKVLHAHPNATSTSDGFMASADKVKMDAAVPAATGNTLVLRDAFGTFSAGAPTVADHVTTKAYVDSQFASGGTTVATPLAVTNWTNTGAVSRKNNGTYTQIDLDLVLTRAVGSPNLAVANAFVSCGFVIPTTMRSTSTSDVRYYPGWVAGGGFNLPVQYFVNMNSGEVMVRQQSGTAVNLVPGCMLHIAHPMHLLTANLP
jgi:hypothetical protein